VFKKFPEPIRIPIFTSEINCYPLMPVDEVLAQHVDEWNTIRRKVRKLNTEDGWSLMYNAIINFLEALPQQRKLLPKHHGDIVAEMLKDESKEKQK